MTILDEIAARLPDNTSEQITPAILRQVLVDMVADYIAVAGAITDDDSGLASLSANNTFAGVQVIANNTASSGVNSGALQVVGGIGTQGDVHSKSVNPHVAPNAAWGIDFSPAGQITVPGSGSYQLATGSGLVMMTDSAVSGQTGLYLIGGSATASAVKIGGGSHYDNPTVTPSANNYSVGFDGTNWRIYNGNASAVTFFVGLIRCRNTN